MLELFEVLERVAVEYYNNSVYYTFGAKMIEIDICEDCLNSDSVKDLAKILNTKIEDSEFKYNDMLIIIDVFEGED